MQLKLYTRSMLGSNPKEYTRNVHMECNVTPHWVSGPVCGHRVSIDISQFTDIRRYELDCNLHNNFDKELLSINIYLLFRIFLIYTIWCTAYLKYTLKYLLCADNNHGEGHVACKY